MLKTTTPPTPAEVERARTVLAAADKAKQNGKPPLTRAQIVTAARKRLTERREEYDAAKAERADAEKALEETEYLRALRRRNDAAGRQSIASGRIGDHGMHEQLRASVPDWCRELFRAIADETRELNRTTTRQTQRYYDLQTAYRDRQKTFESPDCEAICERLKKELGLTITAAAARTVKTAVSKAAQAVGLTRDDDE